jgi:hypothetical protein
VFFHCLVRPPIGGHRLTLLAACLFHRSFTLWRVERDAQGRWQSGSGAEDARPGWYQVEFRYCSLLYSQNKPRHLFSSLNFRFLICRQDIWSRPWLLEFPCEHKSPGNILKSRLRFRESGLGPKRHPPTSHRQEGDATGPHTTLW